MVHDIQRVEHTQDMTHLQCMAYILYALISREHLSCESESQVFKINIDNPTEYTHMQRRMSNIYYRN